jgi:NADPH:quinone reductase-like Zn-dependent oxidoreductase/quercetin dioxygenase-like cupin family protein
VPARSVAARVQAYGGADAVRVDDVPVPTPGAGQVLVRVTAAGVNGLDWKVREGYVRDAYPLALPATLGVELAGVVVRTGPGVTRFAVGDRVMGPLGGLGAFAGFVATAEDVLARTPASLSDVEAAALPVAALTAWQALHAAGELRAGQTVLVHGAAGAVGGFAVQLAKAAGATVLATASAASHAHVRALGADVVIDYRAQRFEDHASAVDLVVDLIGGETLDRSWAVLAPDGAVVSAAAPDIAARAPAGLRGVWLMMRPDPEQLARLADDVARGALSSTIAEVVDLSGLAAAIERNRTGHPPGKIVLDLARLPAAGSGSPGRGADGVYPPLPPDDPRRRLAIARPDTDAALPHVGIGSGTYTILLTGRDTAGRYTLIDMHVPPGGGPPPHRHDFEEMFTVLEGEIAVTVRGETIVARAGETVNVPANAPHAFRNTGDVPARLLCLCAPAGQEDFFLEVGLPVAGRTTPPPALDADARAALIATTRALAPKYRSELLGP